MANKAAAAVIWQAWSSTIAISESPAGADAGTGRAARAEGMTQGVVGMANKAAAAVIWLASSSTIAMSESPTGADAGTGRAAGAEGMTQGVAPMHATADSVECGCSSSIAIPVQAAGAERAANNLDHEMSLHMIDSGLLQSGRRWPKHRVL